jgi:hypothetical protein
MSEKISKNSIKRLESLIDLAWEEMKQLEAEDNSPSEANSEDISELLLGEDVKPAVWSQERPMARSVKEVSGKKKSRLTSIQKAFIYKEIFSPYSEE